SPTNLSCTLRHPFNFDLAIELARLGSLGGDHFEYAIVEGRLDLGVINNLWKLQGSLKRTVAALGEIVVLVLVLLFLLLLTLDCKHTISQSHRHVGSLHSR